MELDGMQHFKKISNWIDTYVIQKLDLLKIKRTNKNGFYDYTIITRGCLE